MNKLNEQLIKYATDNFQAMFDQKPDTIGSVQVIKDGVYVEKQIFRFFKSYLKQVEFDKNTGKSYMFGSDGPEEGYIPLPNVFKPFEFLGLGNQCTINWYREGLDYIEPHADCTAKWVGNEVHVINLLRDSNQVMNMDLYSQDKTEKVGFIPMCHGDIVTMDKEFQVTHRHGVGVPPCDRISITFREV